MTDGQIAIDPEFRSLLQPLDPEELAGLEAALIREGIREPLVAWRGLLLDGHNRHAIAERHGLAFEVAELDLPDRDAALSWIEINQASRRNCSQMFLRYLRGRRYEREKKRTPNPEGKNQHTEVTGQSGPQPQTAEALASPLDASPRTIKRDAQLARAVDQLEALAGEDVRQALMAKRAPLTRKEIVAAAKVAESLPEMAEAAVRGVVDGKFGTLKAAQRDYTRAQAIATLEAEPQPLPTGPFRVLAADPPWHYENREDDGTHRAALSYPPMTTPEICALPVAELGADDSILWLWTTNAHVRDAFDVLAAWRFEAKTILTWAKDRMGTGDWLRGQTEHCILAVRGRPTVRLTNQTTLLHGPVREHSRKPEEFFALVDELCPGSKCELFARAERPGWQAWGPETGKFT